MLEHRVQDRQQFSHAGRERNLLRFADGTQPSIEGSDDGIKAGGDNEGKTGTFYIS